MTYFYYSISNFYAINVVSSVSLSSNSVFNLYSTSAPRSKDSSELKIELLLYGISDGLLGYSGSGYIWGKLLILSMISGRHFHISFNISICFIENNISLMFFTS